MNAFKRSKTPNNKSNRKMNARAKTFCSMLVLQKNDFEKILIDFPDYGRVIHCVARIR